jgi:hypothetical protein
VKDLVAIARYGDATPLRLVIDAKEYAVHTKKPHQSTPLPVNSQL